MTQSRARWSLSMVLGGALLAALVGVAGRGVRAEGGLSTPNVGLGDDTAATVGAGSVYWNPGMLGFLERPSILFGADLIVGAVDYARERRAIYQRSDSLDFALPIDADAIDASKTGVAPSVSATPVALAPAFFAVLPIGDSDFTAGLGLYAPYGASAEYPRNGAQKWQIQQANIATLYLSPTITWRASDALAVGVGLSYVLGFAELSKVQDFAAVGDVAEAIERPPIGQTNDFGPDAPPGVRELDVMARPIVIRQAVAHGASFHLGLAARPLPWLRVGVTYHHRVAMTFRGAFTLDMDDDYFTQDLAAQGLQYPARVRGDAALSFPLPSTLLVGVGVDVCDGVSVDAGLTYQMWSAVRRFDVTLTSPDLAQPEVGLGPTSKTSLPRRWRDTVGLQLGTRLALSRRVALSLHAGYATAASPDATIDAGSPDGDRVIAGAGLRVGVTQDFDLIPDVEVQSIFERRVRSSDYDLGNGTYNLTVVALGVHGQVRF